MISKAKSKRNADERRENGLLAFNVDMRHVLKACAKNKGFSIADIMVNWDKIVGEDISGRIVPVSIRAKKLTIGVPSGSIAMEADYMKDIFSAKVNAFFGKEVVTAVKIIQTGGLPSKQLRSQYERRTLKQSKPANELNPKLYDNIDNKELLDALFSLAKEVNKDNNGE